MILGAPFTFPRETFWRLQWPHLPCQALRCKPCTALVPCPQGPLHCPLSQTQLLHGSKKHPITCLPGGPLSCRLNVCLMAISCLNMSWAKPLCEYPENKWLPAGTTAMPPLQSFLMDASSVFLPFRASSQLISFPEVRDLPHRGQRETACVAQPKKNPNLASLFHSAPSPQDIPKLTNPTCVYPASQHHNV